MQYVLRFLHIFQISLRCLQHVPKVSDKAPKSLMGVPRGPEEAPRKSQDGSKKPQEGFKTTPTAAQDGPMTAHDDPQVTREPPRAPKTPRSPAKTTPRKLQEPIIKAPRSLKRPFIRGWRLRRVRLQIVRVSSEGSLARTKIPPKAPRASRAGPERPQEAFHKGLAAEARAPSDTYVCVYVYKASSDYQIRQMIKLPSCGPYINIYI